ncbi:PP2C family protein-serine/threonine phosphatase [Piscinibacterium candidicorallinum]|uniref:PP2C family protein-serine/threonine phosphatase n=1 Tax=Piscinibacterium candidicorallinum TaxID=1793872 RepID=A0ABV7GYR4_9BURK
MKRYTVNACTAQHIGDRQEQQDRLTLMASPHVGGALIAVVADGMGGKTGGAMAANQVISTARNFFKDWRPSDAIEAGLDHMVEEAHTVIQLAGFTEEKEPHSTAVALVVTPQRCHWMHVGDSRLYHFRAGQLMDRTLDHSYVQDMISAGKLTEQQAATHKYRNMITSALGTKSAPRVTHAEITDHGPGDYFLLCSDGVWAYFSDDELARIIHTLPPREAAELLVQLSRERARGKGDNLSLIIVKLDPPDLVG